MQSLAIGESKLRAMLAKLLGFGLTMFASVGSFGFFAIHGVLLARMLGPEQRGAFAAAVMFPQALLYLGMLGAPELFAGYAAQGMSNAELRRSAARYGLFAGLLSTVACLALDWWLIPSNMRDQLPWAALCALTMPLQQIRLSVQAVDHGQRNFTRYNHVRLVAAAIFPLLLAVAFSLGWRDLSHACILFVVSQLLGLWLIRFGMDASWIGPTAVPVRHALREARGLMGAWLSTEILERIDLVLMMILIADQETLGHYAAAVPIAALLIIVPNAVGLYAFNRGAADDHPLTTRDACRFLLLGVGVQLVIAAALAAVLPLAVHFLYGPAFDRTVQFAWLLLPAGALRGLLQATDSYLRARKKPGKGIRARGVAVPILLAVCFSTFPWLGAWSIPLALSIAQAACFAIMCFEVVRDTQQLAMAQESN